MGENKFIKRNMIMGLVVTSLAGAVLPMQTAYAITNNTVKIQSVNNYKHKGSTGHNTNITIKESDWDYSTTEYIIESLNLPLNYTNPWYSKGSDDGAKAVKDYYYLGSIVKDNAESVMVTGYDGNIVKGYGVVKNGEARVYVQALKKGTTTLTVKTTTNDGKTVEYKTKVTVGSAGTAIKYQTAVNPLSYAAYAMTKDGANYLGYLDKFGGMYTTHSFVDTGTIGQSEQTGNKDYLSVYDHPSYPGMSGMDYYKFYRIDNSQFMKDFLSECGAYDMLAAGKTEYEVFDAVTTAMTNKWVYNMENDLMSGGNSRHYSLEKYLDGYDMACGDEAAISAGICEALGFNWFTQSIDSDVANLAVLDGKVYEISSGGANYVEDYNSRLNIASNYSKLEDISLEDLLSGNVVLNVSSSSSNINAGVFYKVSDTYEAGRFQYGADTSNVTVDNSYGVLASGIGTERIMTFHAGVNPQWNKDANDTVSFRYTVPYMERAYYTLKKGATQQLNLVNADWSDFSLKTSNSAVATVSSTGKITMKGSGTATIILTSKKISGLSIKVLVSSSSVTASTAKEKAGTFYSKNDSIYSGDTTNIIAGNYMRIHE